MGIQRLDPLKHQAVPLGLLAGADVDVVQNLQMVGEKLYRRDEDGAPTCRGDLGHQVREIRLHPFAGLVAGTLPAEGPVPSP
jgi:hypothetical protein